MIRNAYSENYVYLIKRPQDQYQVILEATDNGTPSLTRYQRVVMTVAR